MAAVTLHRAACVHGQIAWREAGHGTPLLLLHGIGSGSGSWAGQFEGLAHSYRVLAWDAPGYGDSDPLTVARPLGGDYASALTGLLAASQVEGPVIVVGHSLGAIVAAAWAAQQRQRVGALVLASPARGYRSASVEVRDSKYRERIELVERLGIAGMAAERSAALCAPGASGAALEAVRSHMARATPGGYAQAAWMLAHDDLLAYLKDAPVPRAVLCGELDRTTPPAACEQVARDCGAPFVPLRGVAHACYVEDPAQFNAALLACLNTR